ncbi:MAG TPA: hypothetical protein VI382_08110 [Candidatus Manganitrophaceae bacterium]|nr:hypothetical protein [Candidatus Manganitrophaceae bacterium]
MKRLSLFIGRSVLPLILLLAWGVGPGFAEERITDQVGVVVLENRIFGATAGEGLVRVELSAGERVVAVQSRGINAFVRTSSRLLGFSGALRQWDAVRLDLFDRFIEARVTPRLILVHTQKHLYGFQAGLGRWRSEPISTQETFRELLSGEHIAVVITDRRLLGVSAFLGGFFSIDLSNDESILESTVNDNVAIFSTQNRKLIFRSQAPTWAELR